MQTLTITQLNRYIKALLSEDTKLQDIYIRAEISSFVNHLRSGHFYFILKDSKASVKAVMFRTYASHSRFTPQNGMDVLVRASVGLYEADGTYQLYVTDMQPYGVGSAELEQQQKLERLEQKGYFSADRKKELPLFPQVIGVVTSNTGAAFADIKTVIAGRYPLAKIILAPAQVQGEQAVESLIGSLRSLSDRCDVIIVGRGGGSKEDLRAFNSEALAEAMVSLSTPIISAVGHEVDITICDLVADKRAATPTQAAEFATPSCIELLSHLQSYKKQLFNAEQQIIQTYMYCLQVAKNKLEHSNPYHMVREYKLFVDQLQHRLHTAQYNYMSKKKQQLHLLNQTLHSANPITLLKRGYTVVLQNEQHITSITQIDKSVPLKLLFADGEAWVDIDRLLERDYNE